MELKQVPAGLRVMFLIHFLVDFLIGIPLMFFPVGFLNTLGFTTIDPFASRMVAAALLAIGGISYLTHKKDIESFIPLLKMKIIWSITVVIGIFLTMQEPNAPKAGWTILIIFAVFSAVWIYYNKKLS